MNVDGPWQSLPLFPESHLCFRSPGTRIEGLLAQHLLSLFGINADIHQDRFPSPLRAEICLCMSQRDVPPGIHTHGLNCLKIISRLCWETKGFLCQEKSEALQIGKDDQAGLIL